MNVTCYTPYKKAHDPKKHFLQAFLFFYLIREDLPKIEME